MGFLFVPLGGGGGVETNRKGAKIDIGFHFSLSLGEMLVVDQENTQTYLLKTRWTYAYKKFGNKLSEDVRVSIRCGQR